MFRVRVLLHALQHDKRRLFFVGDPCSSCKVAEHASEGLLARCERVFKHSKHLGTRRHSCCAFPARFSRHFRPNQISGTPLQIAGDRSAHYHWHQHSAPQTAYKAVSWRATRMPPDCRRLPSLQCKLYFACVLRMARLDRRGYPRQQALTCTRNVGPRDRCGKGPPCVQNLCP